MSLWHYGNKTKQNKEKRIKGNNKCVEEKKGRKRRKKKTRKVLWALFTGSWTQALVGPLLVGRAVPPSVRVPRLAIWP